MNSLSRNGTRASTPLPENYLISYEAGELTDHQISLMCWNSVFQLLASSVDRRKLSRVWDAINDMVPTEVMQELLSTKSLTLDVFTVWTGGSKGTLVDQKRKEKAQASHPQHYSDLELQARLTGQSME
jgi:hypothetical protein